LDYNYLTNGGGDISGVVQLAESLKLNSSLTSLSYVLHSLNSSPKCQDPLTSPLPSSFLCSLKYNNLGPTGAEALSEGLALNKSLTSLEYAASLPFLAVNTS
jgi:hypothetical protein